MMQLKAVIKTMAGASGPVECIVIPIEANHLFRGDKGIYLDLIAFEIQNKKNDSKDTHLVKQSVAKEAYEKMTEEEKNSQPILGNLRVWGEWTEPEPQSSMTPTTEIDDLPF